MAWFTVVPPSPRHPYERYQVRYQDGKRQRSAGIFPTRRRAEAERRAIERGRPELVAPAQVCRPLMLTVLHSGSCRQLSSTSFSDSVFAPTTRI
jgi:hypothetical protein